MMRTTTTIGHILYIYIYIYIYIHIVRDEQRQGMGVYTSSKNINER